MVNQSPSHHPAQEEGEARLETNAEHNAGKASNQPKVQGLGKIGPNHGGRISTKGFEYGDGLKFFANEGSYRCRNTNSADEQGGEPNQAKVPGQLIQQPFQPRLGRTGGAHPSRFPFKAASQFVHKSLRTAPWQDF